MPKHLLPFLQLFRFFADEDVKETFFNYIIHKYEELKARRGFLIATVFCLLQIVQMYITLFLENTSWKFTMLKNYLKMTLRNIKRHKRYSFINIAGLSVGMTCFVLIMLYVQYELSFDTFHEKADRLYRIIERRPGDIRLGHDYYARTPAHLAPTLLREYPEVANATRISVFADALIIYRDKSFYNSGIYADEHFFDVFTFPLMQGEEKSALKEPFSLVITEKMAKKYFGDENPIGKTLNIHINNRSYDLKITGITKKPPENSHILFDFILSIGTLEALPGNRGFLERNYTAYYTYVELQKDFPYKELEQKFPSFIDKYIGKSSKKIYIIQPVKRIHLHSHFNKEISQNNDIRYIFLFTAVGFIILLIACINYINFSTARSTKRAKEICIRKVVGAQRIQLIKQFIGESVLLSIIALIIAIHLIVLILPSFNSFVDRPIALNFFKNPVFPLALFGIALFTGILSGSYPALLLSSFQPVKVLKNSFVSGSKNSMQRNILVVTQFIVSIILIAGTIVIYSQLHYIKNRKLGYNREHIVVVSLKDTELKRNFQTMKTELLRNSEITGVTRSNQLPIGIHAQSIAQLEGKAGEKVNMSMYISINDHDFIDTFEIELLSGRNFSREFVSDNTKAVILNETAVKQLDWENPIGKNISVWSIKDGRIIGIIKDFHFLSLHLNIKPLALVLLTPDWYSYLFVRIKTGDIPGTLTFLERTYNKFSLEHPFEYYFLDESFNRMYNTEQKFGSLFIYFSSLALFLACLGLFGLVSFTTEQRTKEIGIRKVFGASISGIVLLLLKKLITLVIISNIIAWPVAYYAMNRWLENFAYRINIGLGIFLISGVIALVIALLTASFHSIKTATANPIDSLRYE